MNNYFAKNNLKIVIILINLIHNLKLRKKYSFFIIPLELHNTTECLDKCYKHGLVTKEILIKLCVAISSR